jgi:hypothetical protein
MVYAGLAYAAFAAAALWAIAFLADLSTPHAVDGASRIQAAPGEDPSRRH